MCYTRENYFANSKLVRCVVKICDIHVFMLQEKKARIMISLMYADKSRLIMCAVS